MDEIKFSYVKEESIPESPALPNVFSGKYKFATQSTAVYDDHAFIITKNEILKLNVACDRAYYDGSHIWILKGRKLDIYDALKYQKTVNFADDESPRRLYDILPVEKLQKYLEGSYDKEIVHFAAGKKILEITPSHVKVDDRVVENTIHENDAIYFVAHGGVVTVIGNDKSYEFMYFIDGVKNEPEECFSLSLRLDEESFDTINAKDVKFIGESLLLKDAEKNVYYSLEGVKYNMPGIVTNCTVNENEIKKDTIDKKAVAKENDITKEKTIMEDIVDKKDSKKEFQGLTLCENTKKKEVSSFGSSKDVVEISKNDISKDSNKKKDNLKIDGNFSGFKSIQNALEATLPDKSILNDLLSSKSQVSPETPSLFSATEKPSIASSDLANFDVKKDSKHISFSDTSSSFLKAMETKPTSSLSSVQTKVLPQSQVASVFSVKEPAPAIKKKSKEECEIDEIEIDLKKKIEGLKSQMRMFSGLCTDEVSYPKYIKSEIEFSRLYNLVYNGKISNYNKQITAMMSSMEILNLVDTSHIEEGIKYIDSALLARPLYKQTVRYNYPLVRTGLPNKSMATVDSLIESMQMVKVTEAGQCSKPDSHLGGYSSVAPNSLSPSEGNKKDTGRNMETRTPTAGTTITPAKVTIASDKPSNDNLTSSNSLFVASQNSVQTGNNSSSVVQAQQCPLFNGVTPSTGSSFQNSDTTRIFDNLSTAGASIFGKSQPQDTQQDNSSSTGSAFSRFAGSRRLFK
ncbi:hypothetical protein PAEPH01_0492 [Pancytospora epiphaga]|nr:hypothetical protein PAEPH01_0492 [Pancytospora epiphaga]